MSLLLSLLMAQPQLTGLSPLSPPWAFKRPVRSSSSESYQLWTAPGYPFGPKHSREWLLVHPAPSPPRLCASVLQKSSVGLHQSYSDACPGLQCNRRQPLGFIWSCWCQQPLLEAPVRCYCFDICDRTNLWPVPDFSGKEQWCGAKLILESQVVEFWDLHLEECASLLFGPVDSLILHLQLVQNSAACMISRPPPLVTSPVLQQLYWLPINSVSSIKSFFQKQPWSSVSLWCAPHPHTWPFTHHGVQGLWSSVPEDKTLVLLPLSHQKHLFKHSLFHQFVWFQL